MSELLVDPAYLRYQYDDADKLRVRIATHAQYSERTSDSFASWLLQHVDAARGQMLLDVGCGSGVYHPPLAETGARIVAGDASRGMLRTVLDQAAAGSYMIAALSVDAQALPFRDASFERVMANHMLYHVPDQRAALRELRRVVKPDGRAVMATNGADNYRQFDALHRAAAAKLGYTTIAHDASAFTLDDLALVRSAFPSAEVFTRADALVFPDAAAALRYYTSGPIDGIEDRPADGSHREPLLREMGAAIEAIIAREGAFRVSKTAGCFVAVV
jgi:ubiquinone/menaquinone biosynthesis C-methylase UbiE